ncbi:hypothetical protein [Nocardioides conyzicola]|uniref:hypothetical protein n=1 Tax=Nocardioides conyzicola TaxID=1651781 RepID=UPI0031E688E0
MATAGWTRLVATLAARAAGRVEVDVGLVTTTFRGSTERLDRVRAWLDAPDLTDLDAVRRELAADPPDVGAVEVALLVRYGAQGPGLAGLGETGLGSVTPDALRAHVERCLAGTPPAAVRIPRDPAYSHGYAYGTSVVIASGVVPVDAADALGEDLARALREEVGGTGEEAPWWRAEQVDADHAVLVVAGWRTRSTTSRWREARPLLLDEVGLPGATDFAETLLVGAHPKVLDFVLGVPEAGWQHAPSEGTGYRHRGNEQHHLRVDGRGVHFDYGWGGPFFPADQLAAVLAHPGGARTLVAQDGLNMTVQPQDWRDGAGAVAEIDELAGSRLLPQLTDPAAEREQRLPGPPRVPEPRTTVALLVGAFALLLALVVSVVVAFTLADVPPTPFVLVGGVAALTAGLVVRRRARRAEG